MHGSFATAVPPTSDHLAPAGLGGKRDDLINRLTTIRTDPRMNDIAVLIADSVGDEFSDLREIFFHCRALLEECLRHLEETQIEEDEADVVA